MTQLLAIAFGGAMGALCRFWLVELFEKITPKPFPYGTLAVNIIGSFLLGLLYVLIIEKLHFSQSISGQARSTLMIGFLGAFTTFSTFALEVVTLIESNHLVMAIGYLASSVIVCILAVAAAFWFARLF